MYIIEKNIPIPNPTSKEKGCEGDRNGTEFTKTLRILDVGDSFVVAGKTVNSVSGTLNRISKETKFTYLQRLSPDGSIRIWRIK